MRTSLSVALAPVLWSRRTHMVRLALDGTCQVPSDPAWTHVSFRAGSESLCEQVIGDLR